MHELINQFGERSSSVIREWEDAGESLANSLAAYLKSCKSLETFSSTDSIDAKHLASRIDLSLSTLHAKLSHELAQSRVLLARTRNKTFPRFFSLPNEVIAAIFKEVVYVPPPDDLIFLSASEALSDRYERLYNLLLVCVAWRNLGIQLAELWSVIPMDSNPKGSPTREATALILQRSRASPLNDRPLHLAAILSTGNDSSLPLVDGKLPRFTSINIESNSVGTITALIRELLQHPSTLTLPELSIHHDRGEKECSVFHPQLPNNWITSYPSIDSRLFTKLLSSLSILRIKGLSLNWNEIAFPNKLVKLRLQSVVFGDQSKAFGFLSALQSASELKHLKIISFATFLEETGSVPSGASGLTISFPKLQALLLQDLDYTTLWIFFGSIVPSLHQTKLFLTSKTNRVYISGGNVKSDMEVPTRVYYALLGRSAVNTLILHGDYTNTNWLDHAMLRKTLKLLPTLKTLKIAAWCLTTESFKALERPQATKTNSKLDHFPNLDALCIYNTYIEGKKALSRVVTSHSLQTLVLDGQIEIIGDNDRYGSFDEDHPVARQIGSCVPHFQVLPEFTWDEDFRQDVWKLW